MNTEMSENKKQPVALITGSAQRIGEAIARKLHENDYRVIIHCLNSTNKAEALVNEFNQVKPNSAFFISADLSSTEGCESLVSQTLSHSNHFNGRLDVLINNASTFYPTKLTDFKNQEWQQLMNTNLRAPYILSSLAAEQLKRQQGTIINITDIHGAKPLSGYGIYSLSKAGLISLTKLLATELAPDVRVNAVSPGAILWPESEKDDTKKQQEILSKIPLGKMGNVEHIAEAVLLLLQNKYITGQILPVDGGRNA